MTKEILQRIGLAEGEALVYDFLLENGEASAGQIIKRIKLKRGNVYNILKSLVTQGLTEQFEKNKIAYFRLEHPTRLKVYVSKKATEVEEVHKTLNEALPGLISRFNLSHFKPVVHYFESEDGIRELLEDSLTAKTEIYSYADIETVIKHLDKINKWYVKKRDALGIKKRVMMVDTPFARNYMATYFKDVTTTKLIKLEAAPFQSVMQIYDNKVSYVTLSTERLIGVLVEDKGIYEMHRDLFDYLWRTTPGLTI